MSFDMLRMFQINLFLWFINNHIFNIIDSFHLIIRITAKYKSVDFSVILGVDTNLFPHNLIVKIFAYFFSKVKMFHVQINPHFSYFLWVQSAGWIFFHILILDNYRNLRIPISEQTSIINVCAANNNFLVIDDHEFRMDINLLSNGYSLTGKCMSSQTINF